MRAFRKCTRISILCLLGVSVFVPLFLLADRLKSISPDSLKEYVEDLSIINYRKEAQTLNAIEQDEVESLKEPSRVVYKDEVLKSAFSFTSMEDSKFRESVNAADDVNQPRKNATSDRAKEDDHRSLQEEKLPILSGKKEDLNTTVVRRDRPARSSSWKALDQKVKEMRDQVIRAKAYLNFSPANSTSHVVKELRLRIKEVEKAMMQSTKDSHVSQSSLQKMKAMESTLSRARRIYPDCSAMVKKLRAMTYVAEEQVQVLKKEESFLKELGGRTMPKGFHCLSMRLTAEYFALDTEKREFPNKHKIYDPDLYHFALFSDNILASSVVVNSTILTARAPERIVFHIVTDPLTFPAMSMWFLLNSPGKATIHIESIDSFESLSIRYNKTLQKEGSVDPRYISELNHLRFYLPDVFPLLNKIVLLDHDVVVQKDLSGLWSIDMRGEVNGAVETCSEGEPSFRRMDMFVNFTDPMIAENFDSKSCTWAFGMNVFDLQEWRRRGLTGLYHKYIHLGNKRPLWKAGSLPIGWIMFYNHTLPLDKKWHALGLGYDSGASEDDIEKAAVIHFDGMLKPWLDIGLENYKSYWTKHVNYDHPFLQQCNVHE